MSKEIGAKELQRQALAKAHYERITGATAKARVVPPLEWPIPGITKGVTKPVTVAARPVTKPSVKGGRPKTHKSLAEKQKAYRDRRKAKT